MDPDAKRRVGRELCWTDRSVQKKKKKKKKFKRAPGASPVSRLLLS